MDTTAQGSWAGPDWQLRPVRKLLTARDFEWVTAMDLVIRPVSEQATFMLLARDKIAHVQRQPAYELKQRERMYILRTL